MGKYPEQCKINIFFLARCKNYFFSAKIDMNMMNIKKKKSQAL